MDSGTSTHITSNHQKINVFEPSTLKVRIQEVKTGGGEFHSVQGIGKASVKTSTHEIKLKNVKYIPSMRKNLISIGSITDTSTLFVFLNTCCWVLDKLDSKQILALGYRDFSNGLYSFGQHLQAYIVSSDDYIIVA